MGSNAVWFSVLIIGTIVFTVLPFIILHFKKASWLTPGNAFVPFHWDKSPEAQAALAKAAEEFNEEELEDEKEAQKSSQSKSTKDNTPTPTNTPTPNSTAS